MQRHSHRFGVAAQFGPTSSPGTHVNHELEIRLEKAEQALRVSEATVRALAARLEALEKKVDVEATIATAQRLELEAPTAKTPVGMREIRPGLYADLQPRSFFLRRPPKP